MLDPASVLDDEPEFDSDTSTPGVQLTSSGADWTVTIDEPFRHSLSGYMKGAEDVSEGGRRKRLSVLDAGGAA